MTRGYRIFTGVIVGITAATFAWEYAQGSLNLGRGMMEFMVIYFAVFGAVKLFDLPGFVRAYRAYDLIAERFPIYGYVYPFIELAISGGYLFGASYASPLTIAVALIGIAGVLRQKMKGGAVQCACLGAHVSFPLGGVSLAENIFMGGMAMVMLVGVPGMAAATMGGM